jgi:hypothetical protein
MTMAEGQLVCSRCGSATEVAVVTYSGPDGRATEPFCRECKERYLVRAAPGESRRDRGGRRRARPDPGPRAGILTVMGWMLVGMGILAAVVALLVALFG